MAYEFHNAKETNTIRIQTRKAHPEEHHRLSPSVALKLTHWQIQWRHHFHEETYTWRITNSGEAMSDTQLHPTRGPWYIVPNGGAWEIATEPEGVNVIGLSHDQHEAVLMASAPSLVDALIEVQEITEEMNDADIRERILDALSRGFGKIFQEAS